LNSILIFISLYSKFFYLSTEKTPAQKYNHTALLSVNLSPEEGHRFDRQCVYKRKAFVWGAAYICLPGNVLYEICPAHAVLLCGQIWFKNTAGSPACP
jgi:hypothetical protein